MSATLAAGPGSLYLNIATPLESDGTTPRDDVISVKVWYSTSSATFVPPGAGTLGYDGTGLSITLSALNPGITYYVRYALISEIDPDNYVVSAVYTSTPLSAPQVIDISGYASFTQAVSGVFTPTATTLTASQININNPAYSWVITGATPATATGASVTVTPTTNSTGITATVTVSGTNTSAALVKAVYMPVVYNGAVGQAGANGTMTAFPSIYIWTANSTAPTRPATTSTYTWSTGAYSAPANWSTTPTANTTPGSYLWQLTFPAVATSTVPTGGTANTLPTTTTLDWTLVANPIRAISYNGTNGTNGNNGSGTFVVDRAASSSSAAPTDAEVTAVIGRTPVAGDIATVRYNNGSNATIWKFTTSWVTTTTYLTGDLIVDGTITGAKIVANSVTADRIDSKGLSIKAADGTVILNAGASIALTTLSLPGTVSNIPSGWLNSNISVGGANLMRNSGNFATATGWTTNGGTVTYSSTISYGNFGTLQIAGPINGASNSTVMRLKPNTQYTISAMVKGSLALADAGYDTTLHIQNWTTEIGEATNVHQEAGGAHDLAVTTSWKRIYQTFTTASSANLTYCRFYFYPLTATLQLNIGYVKLEEGNVPTDWVMNEEDAAAVVAAVQVAAATDATTKANAAQTAAITAAAADAATKASAAQTAATTAAATDAAAKATAAQAAAIAAAATDAATKASAAQIAATTAAATDAANKVAAIAANLYKDLWLVQRYDTTTAINPGGTVPTYDIINKVTLSASTYVANTTTTFTWSADNYVGVAGCTIYSDNAWTWAVNISHDDNGTIYINGTKTYDNVIIGPTARTLNIPAGWCTIELMWAEQGGGDFFTLSQAISARTEVKQMWGRLDFSGQANAAVISTTAAAATAQSTATTATTNAATAQTAANTAATAAATAATAAATAQTTANNAATAAAAAQTTANNAATAAADRLSKSVASILGATVSINAVAGAGFVAGDMTWNAAGARTAGKGVAMTPGGIVGHNGTDVTFAVNATTGNATFKGDITGSNGTFSGTVQAGILKSSDNLFVIDLASKYISISV